MTSSLMPRRKPKPCGRAQPAPGGLAPAARSWAPRSERSSSLSETRTFANKLPTWEACAAPSSAVRSRPWAGHGQSTQLLRACYLTQASARTVTEGPAWAPSWHLSSDTQGFLRAWSGPEDETCNKTRPPPPRSPGCSTVSVPQAPPVLSPPFSGTDQAQSPWARAEHVHRAACTRGPLLPRHRTPAGPQSAHGLLQCGRREAVQYLWPYQPTPSCAQAAAACLSMTRRQLGPALAFSPPHNQHALQKLFSGHLDWPWGVLAAL